MRTAMPRKRVRTHHQTSHVHDHTQGGLGVADPQAHASHNQMNKTAGMPEGISPVGSYDGNEVTQNESTCDGNGLSRNEQC